MHHLKALGSPTHWLGRVTRARSGQVALFWASFLEAVIVPIPLETVLAPYMQMRRDIVWRLAAVGVAGFLAAALLSYAFGALVFDAFGGPMLAATGWSEEFAAAETFILANGFWALIVIVTSPVPSLVAMVGAGAVGFPLAPFVLAMLVARGSRYFALGLLVLVFGDRLVDWLTRRHWFTRRGRATPPV